ncbi:MAG: hypothetical protein D6698_11910 [Gammaproteobacteria bacterium]|nr:MAG: hypothetical protein D6698_11910 [Gammaproteobacteria bacterium]
MARILAVGVAVIDVIMDVPAFPQEDSELRATHHLTRVGGNATNTLTVLSQLDHQCHWAGTLADDSSCFHIRQHFDRMGINSSLAQVCTQSSSPLSTIIRTQKTGSRTIIHHRRLPELQAADLLDRLDTKVYDWVHFEGRNCLQTERILKTIKQRRPDLPISIEIEKKRPDDEKRLLQYGEPLFFSKHYVQERNQAQNPIQFMHTLSQRYPGRFIICPWGEAGVYALDQESTLHHQPAWKNGECVDSVGAGDVLIAGVIHGFLKRWPVAEILASACRLAGKKCAQEGLQNLIA